MIQEINLHNHEEVEQYAVCEKINEIIRVVNELTDRTQLGRIQLVAALSHFEHKKCI